MEHHGAHHPGPAPGPVPSVHGNKGHGLLTRFLVCMALTVPILLLTPEVQDLLSFRLDLPYSELTLLLLSTVVFLYGGWPFLSGMVEEGRKRRPGMMTLVALAISVAYIYSAASVLTLRGSTFFWELATLIDIMLLGHYLEMRSVQGASTALEELARVLPAEADLVGKDGTRKVPVTDLRPGDLVLVRPGSKVPTDGKVVEGGSDVNESLPHRRITSYLEVPRQGGHRWLHQRRWVPHHSGDEYGKRYLSQSGHRTGAQGPGEPVP